LEINGVSAITSGVDIGGTLFSAGILSTSLFLVSLVIFLALAVKSKTVKSFQSQISIFVGAYVAGELLELQGIQSATGLPADLGSQIHVVATITITLILWSRLFSSSKTVKKLVERENVGQEGSQE
jgi:hypothetical protein